MSKKTQGRNIKTLAVIFIIIGLLAFLLTLRDYRIEMDGVMPVLVSKISIPRPSSLHVNNSQVGKLTVTTASQGTRVGGYEFRISRFSNMAFAHSFRSVEPKKEIGKLKPGKRYYLQARCYKANQMGRNVFGRWGTITSSEVREE